MGEFLALIAGQVGWAIPVGVVLWFVARRITSVVPSPTAATETSREPSRPPWLRALALLAIAAMLWALAVGLGWLITQALGQVRDVDAAIMDWFGDNRTDAATAVALVIDRIGDTPGIIVVILIAAPVAHAVTRRWAPALVLVAAPAGETAIFLAAQFTISRARPDIEHLAVEPVTSSFPSGHVAATLVMYGCLALLIVSWSTHRARFLAIGIAVVLPLAVAWARMYQGMHFPSDVLVSLTFASLWLAACWWAFSPGARGVTIRFGMRPSDELDSVRRGEGAAEAPEAVGR